MDSQLEILKEDLSSLDSIVWKNAISRLVSAGTEEAHKILLTAMNDQRAEVRMFAKKALEKLQNSDGEGDFLVKFRNRVISADGKSVDVADFERLLDGTPSFKKRIILIQEGAKTKDRKLLPFLVKSLEKEKHPWVVATLVKCVGGFGDERLIPLLQQYLKHKDNRVRANTVEGMELIGSEKVVPVVLKCLEDPDNRVKANAIKCLNKFGAVEVKKSLETMIAGGVEETIYSAIFALRVIGNDYSVEKLVNILKNHFSSRIRYRAKNAIIELAVEGNAFAHKLISEDEIFYEELYLENIIGLKNKNFFKGREIIWIGEVVYALPDDSMLIMKDSLSHERFVLLSQAALVETETVEIEGDIVDFFDNSIPLVKARKISRVV